MILEPVFDCLMCIMVISPSIVIGNALTCLSPTFVADPSQSFREGLNAASYSAYTLSMRGLYRPCWFVDLLIDEYSSINCHRNFVSSSVN